MMDSNYRPLRVFLCHASGDKPEVQELYSRLTSDGIDAWLDKDKLIPGQNWEVEITRAVKFSDVVIVCLSSQSINKEGFVQKEIRIALDAADQKPEGTIFIIPARLENCNLPERISKFHWVDLFSSDGYDRLLKALLLRANTVGAKLEPISKRIDYPKEQAEEFPWKEHYSNNSQTRIETDEPNEQEVERLRQRFFSSIPRLEDLTEESITEIQKGVRKLSGGVIELYRPTEGFDCVGGLDPLKKWLLHKMTAFSKHGQELGLPAPHALLIVGISGCGKSLIVQAAAKESNLPLLRYDFGQIYDPLMGKAEFNLRKGWEAAEAIAPCILWIDELDVLLYGSGRGYTEGASVQRLFGRILNWMSTSYQKKIFVIITAQALDNIPPEVIRKGRFDEVFFVDLPSAEERLEIFKIHLKKFGQEYASFDLDQHVAATEEFSGAEIAHAISSAVFDAVTSNDSPINDTHIADAIATIIPFAKSQEDKILHFRKIARETWRRAT